MEFWKSAPSLDFLNDLGGRMSCLLDGLKNCSKDIEDGIVIMYVIMLKVVAATRIPKASTFLSTAILLMAHTKNN